MKKLSLVLILMLLVVTLCACNNNSAHIHSYTEQKVDPTCTEQGYTKYTCECGETYEDDYVKALGHSFGEWVETKAPTEEAEGEQERVCECGEKETKKIQKLPHTHEFIDNVVEPTCTTKGYTEHACRCGESYKDSYVSELPHEYTSVVVEPTCTEKGYTEYTCKCSHSYKDKEVAELGHDFGEWKVVKKATPEAEGLKERVCHCGEKETEAIPYVEDKVAPVIDFGSDNSVKLNTFKTFNPLEGVTAYDEIDGNLTDSIIVEGEVDNETRGTYILTYRVSDLSGNETVKERRVDVIWDYVTSFIGHGGSYYGVMNSEEAILYAASVLKYQAIEVDVKVTKDGVFVLSHDNTFGGVTIASTNYADLKDVVHTTSKSGSGTYPLLHGEYEGNKVYKSTICTLERYLEICKEYGVRPVIELKAGTGLTNSDQSNMGRLMKTIEDAGLIDDCILLGSAYNCLIWTRQNGYANVECQYLVDSCASQTYLDRCLQYDLDISICVTYGNGQTENTPEWIARYQAEGIKVSTYTFTQYTDYKDVQKWLDIGVDFVTVDWHTMSKLKHYETGEGEIYTVTFVDQKDNIIREVYVKEGKTAGAPKAPEVKGYKFVGWDKDLKNVTSDMTVKAVYEIDKYSISYNANLDVITEKTFATKEEFVNAFYTDFFNWLVANKDNIEYISEANGVYTVKRNTSSNGTATFSSVEELKALDIYVFESALSSLIYKPISGTNSEDYIPEVDEAYFLNSEPYRTKYMGMNAYLLSVMNTSYTSYSKTFSQASYNRVQIFFRFHQWAKGTNIAAFNSYPSYFEVSEYEGEITLPSVSEYTVEDEVVLEAAKTEGKVFVGWYLEKDCINKVEKIEKGTTGNITLYGKWE